MHALHPNEHSLDDLVRETGFSKRQIRFYITRKLIPGAGESRGPNAVYGEETLRRLQLIKVLRDMKIEPTGRQMSLDEIGHALDTLSADGIEALLSGGAELTILDTDAGRSEPLGGKSVDSARDYLANISVNEPSMLRSVKGPGRLLGEPETVDSEQIDLYDALADCDQHFINSHAKFQASYVEMPEGGDPEYGIQPSISDLLGRLQALLAGTDPDTRSLNQAGDGEQWLRVTTPDVEFHVRQPDDRRAQLRLARMARDLARLLERED